MENQKNLNFHQTFKPEKQYIGSILNIANNTNSLSVQDISSYTGIPNGKSSGKVEPHINYAKYMGLIDVIKKGGEYFLSRTKLGNIVAMEDPGLQEELSILLCHAMMLRNMNGADMWNAIFMKILPMYRGVMKKELLLKELEQLFEGKVNKKNFAPFLGSYEEMFVGLNILNQDSENISIKEMQYNKEFIFLYAYILYELWDEMFQNQEEISSVQFSTLNYGKIFGWNEQREYEVLEHLSDRGIIRLNRQLVPYTILRLTEKDAVIKRLYSELC